MTALTESSAVAAPDQNRRLLSRQRLLAQQKAQEEHQLQQQQLQQREGRGPSSSSLRPRRDRISPSSVEKGGANATAAPSKMSATSTPLKKELSVHTKWGEDNDEYEYVNNNSASTPRTEASTPSPKAPKAATTVASNNTAAEAPLPDFITQTDKYGNAVTPRSATAIQQARVEHPSGAQPHLHVDKNGKLTEEQDSVDVCTETLLDSIRIMCCCRLPEDAATEKSSGTTSTSSDGTTGGATRSASTATTKNKSSSSTLSDVDERPRLLPKIHANDKGKKCLVLDLDETLVHSSFRAVPGADFVIPVQIEDVVHFVYVAKRPGVDEFLVEMAKYYEIVIYTASLNKYADPLLDLLDTHKVIRTRLFRESCVYFEGNYVKDLSLLDRDLSQSIIIDNSPSSYSFHPSNAIDCSSFIDDVRDRELEQIAAFLKGVKDVKDVRGITQKWREWPNVSLENQ